MLTQHIALVPEEEGLDPTELARVSAAIQKQVTRDLTPLWGLAATVDPFPHLEDVPIGYWPVILTRCELGNHGRVHLDRSGQPYAQVQLRPQWSLAASRACLEILVNPFENRSVTAISLRSDQGPVEFLIEVCGPCEDPRFAYAIDGVPVADFCTPAFFGPRAGQLERCTFRGESIPVLRPQPGGHMTWFDPVSDSFWLRNHWGDNPIDTKLGAVDHKVVSVRELVHACAPLRPGLESELREIFDPHGHHTRASQRRAQQLRALLGKRLDIELDAAIDAMRTDRPRQEEAEREPWLPVAAPAPARAATAAARPRNVVVAVEPEEFEDIDTWVQVFEDMPLEDAAPQAAPPVAAGASAPQPASAPAPRAVAAASNPPPLRLSQQDMRSNPTTTVAPVSLGSLQEKPAGRPKAPLVAALSAAAVLALLWTGIATNANSRSRAAGAAQPQASAPTPPAQPIAQPANALAMAAPTPAAPAAPAAPATAAAAPPAQEAPAATAVAPEPAAAAPKARPVATRPATTKPRATAATAEPRTRPAPGVKPAGQKVAAVYDLPVPPRSAPTMAEPAAATATATASIDDLIEDRR